MEVTTNQIEELIADLKAHKCKKDLKTFRVYLQNRFGNALSVNTLQGHAFLKPHGYPGDYEIIDKIYTKWMSPQTSLRKWDNFFHAQAATKAVRNRKQYFYELIKQVEAKNPNAKILNIGSGPGRDMLEFFQKNSNSKVTFDCVEVDNNAIQYAASLCQAYEYNIRFYNKNIFRFNSDKCYDLIWSAGLFDYFKDKHFIYLIKKLYHLIVNNGQIVVGNFSSSNPSKDYMEIVGEWYLNCRTKKQLILLSQQSGIDVNKVKVKSEPLGVNLFLHIYKD